MKKTIVTLLVVLCAVGAYSQTSSGTWNNKTATYTNSTHGITWTLIEGLVWNRQPTLPKGTVFMVHNDDTHILVSLGERRSDKDGEDAWDFISQHSSKESQDMAKEVARRTGMVFKEATTVKSQLCGIHACKVKTDMTKYYPEQDATVHCVSYTYQLYKNNHVYTVSVTGLSVLEEELGDFDRIATMIFNGFKIK